MAKRAAPRKVQDVVDTATKSARIADMVLAVVFAALAISTSWWVWWAMAGLCVVTAITGPIKPLANFLTNLLLQTKNGR